MIVCVCKAVSDSQIRKAIRGGANTFEDLQLDLGVCVKCGSCESCVHYILNEQNAIEDSSVAKPQQPDYQSMFFQKRI
jgi:bacterioferritin-associated ferredoxin